MIISLHTKFQPFVYYGLGENHVQMNMLKRV